MRLTRTKFLLPVAAAALILSACGSSSDAAKTTPSTTSATAGSSKAMFVLDEWSVVPPKGDVAAGKVAVTATNNGSETHELVIVRAEDASSLPLKADGSVDEDKIPESKKAGEIADLAAGKSATKTLDLPAGDYVAFCNIVDTMGSDGMGSDGMGSDGMGSDGMGNGMNSSTSMGSGMDHVHYKQGMVNYFTVA